MFTTGSGVPQSALYRDEITVTNTSAALAINAAYLVDVTLYAPAVLAAIRMRFASGGAGHYDVGLYDASGPNGTAGVLLAHAAATPTSLATATGTQTNSLIGGNIALSPASYWLALWIDNTTDTFNKATGSVNLAVVQTGITTGPLPALASSLTGLANTGLKPILIGLLQGRWS